MANVYDDEFDEVAGRSPHPGFGARRVYLARRLGSERLGMSVWLVDPGETAYPYHYHLGDEEILVVLEGEGKMRTPHGWHRIGRGDTVGFQTGESGAHQIVNTGDVPLRFLSVSTSGTPDITVYPDSGKIGVAERRPDGGGFREFHRLTDAVDYWEGESPPDMAQE